MPHAYTEDQLVEQPAIGLFAELGWATVSVLEETFGQVPSELGRSRGDETHSSSAESQSLLTSSPTVCLGRETKREVVLIPRLRAVLDRLNPSAPTVHAHPSLGQRPRYRIVTPTRAESPTHRPARMATHHQPSFLHRDEPRRWRLRLLDARSLGRCPRLVSTGPLALALPPETIGIAVDNFLAGEGLQRL